MDIKNLIDNLRCVETDGILEKGTKDTPFYSMVGDIHYGKVVYCTDGDTLDCVFIYRDKLQKFRIRMLGYNSPEKKPKKKDHPDPEDRKQIKAKAKEATDRLKELVLGKNVFIYCDEFDSFGRVLATIRFNPEDEKSVNDMMLEEGHGVPFDK